MTYDVYHHYYNPAIGRFTSEDPIRLDDSPNMYTLELNNSVNYLDPLGLSCSYSGSFGGIDDVNITGVNFVGYDFSPKLVSMPGTKNFGVGVAGVIYNVKGTVSGHIQCKKTCDNCEENDEWDTISMGVPVNKDVTIGIAFGVSGKFGGKLKNYWFVMKNLFRVIKYGKYAHFVPIIKDMAGAALDGICKIADQFR